MWLPAPYGGRSALSPTVFLQEEEGSVVLLTSLLASSSPPPRFLPVDRFY